MADWPDFTLFARERWKFDPNGPEQERAEFLDHATRVSEVQAHLAAKSGQAPRRVFHAKSHGCLLGALMLRSERDAATQRGIFRKDASESYPVLARFSNGKGTINPDFMPDVRGVALKIFEIGPEPNKTLDLLMTNSRVAFGKDHAEFVEFMEASKDGLPGLDFNLGHPRVVASLLKCVWPPRSLAELTYGSGHPYLLGESRAMKMKLAPYDDHVNFLDAVGATFHLIENHDFLRHELAERVSTRGVRFTLSLQLENERDPASTPIEDALFEWTEEASPSLPVAELVFPPQGMTDARRDYVETLSVNPWNYHPEHRPLGNLARGRLFSYAASQQGRAAQQTQPYGAFLQEWNAR